MGAFVSHLVLFLSHQQDVFSRAGRAQAYHPVAAGDDGFEFPDSLPDWCALSDAAIAGVLGQLPRADPLSVAPDDLAR
ncbi:hypothetical protein AQJ91_11745 [Streptomyces dysideae]|uniref:Uncharacterized protein n=1 Tax=Streptomyces dysideae TaxID=909626 RepID=A0A101V1V3_9ACTN|nr:hypothetical protein AQJ91_11745 [Streptomyces dysideae]